MKSLGAVLENGEGVQRSRADANSQQTPFPVKNLGLVVRDPEILSAVVERSISISNTRVMELRCIHIEPPPPPPKKRKYTILKLFQILLSFIFELRPNLYTSIRNKKSSPGFFGGTTNNCKWLR